MAAVAPMAAPSGGTDLSGLVSLAGLFLGKTQNTSGTTGGTSQNSGSVANTGTVTTSENVSDAAVQATVNAILQGSQGLAAVASGQSKVGLYNSTTNQMLVNDLIARTSASAAAMNKTSTVTNNTAQTDTRATTTTGTTNQSVATPAQISPAKAGIGATALGGLSALSKTSAGQAVLAKLGLGTAKKAVGASLPDITPEQAAAAQDIQAKDDGSPFTSNPVNVNASPTAIPDTTAVTPVGPISQTSAPLSNESVDVSNIFAPEATNNFDIVGDYASSPIMDTSGVDMGASTDVGSGEVNLGTADGDSLDYGVGAADTGGVDVASAWDDNSDLGDLFDFAEGGLVTPHGNDRLLGKIKKEETGEQGSRMKTNYATGGMIDLSNLGLRASAGDSGSPMGVASGDQLVQSVVHSLVSNAVASGTGSPTQAVSTTASKGTGSTNTATTVSPKIKAPDVIDEDTGGSTATSGTTSGAVGTPGQNAAAVNGMGIAALGLLGVPGIVASLAAPAINAMAPNSVSSMSPVSNAINAIVSTISGLIGGNNGSPPDGLSGTIGPTDSQGEPATVGDNTGLATDSSTESGGITSGGIASTDGLSTDSMGGVTSGPSNAADDGDGDTSVPDSGGGVGDSSGGSTGDSGDGGGDSGSSMKNGGAIKGPGTSTSDSIPINVSDGEYILNAKAVAAIGKDKLDALNSLFTAS